jgi:FdhD protein
MPGQRVTKRPVTRVTGRSRERFQDTLALERALELRVDGRTLSITLRTPGHDEELALGFLAGEGLIASRDQVAGLELREAACADEPDQADVRLAPGVRMDWARLERHFAATSACGLCGRAHLEALRAGLARAPEGSRIETAALVSLPERARAVQETFEATGGLHAAALAEGDALEISALREDVGRHNAVDKIAGWLLGSGRYPLAGGLLWVSGRAGAEIVLKAARARIPVLAAVGAPSSLAIELAETAGMTLIGFLRGGSLNVYCGLERLAQGS